jgi:hypothetical protein
LLAVATIALVCAVAGSAWLVLPARTIPSSPLDHDSSSALDDHEPVRELSEPPPPVIEIPLAAPPKKEDSNADAARGSASTSVPGIALDEMTGQPIPWLDVELTHHGGTGEMPLFKCKTSLDGTFVLDGLRAGVAYRLRFLDVAADFHSLCRIDLEPPPAGGSRPFKVPIGPTYFLDIHSESPIDVAKLHARLNIDALFVPSAHVRPPTTAWRPVRASAVPWVRFNEWFRNRATVDGAPPTLIVASEDGMRAGAVVVPGTVGAFTTPLEVKLEAVGAIHGVVFDGKGSRQEKVRIELERASKDIPMRVRAGPNDAVVTGAHGEFSFGCLFPGKYAVRAMAYGNYPQRATVEVFAGRATDVRIEMEPKDTGTVRGSLVSSGGANWREPPLVCLARVGGSREVCSRCAIVQPPVELGDKTGRLIQGKFEIRGVPIGEYTVTVVLPTTQGRSEYVWNPASVDVHAAEASVLVEFFAPRFEFGGKFEVFDANNGRPILTFGVLDYTDTRVHAPHPDQTLGLHSTLLALQRGLTSDKPAIEIDEHVPVRWMVVADGYQPEWGDETGFEWDPSSGRPKPCVVRLRPGWGAMVYAFRDDELEIASPLRGVSVIGDGEELGVTDVDGLVGVRAIKKPTCLTFECFGYHLVHAFGVEACRLGPKSSTVSALMISN